MLSDWGELLGPTGGTRKFRRRSLRPQQFVLRSFPPPHIKSLRYSLNAALKTFRVGGCQRERAASQIPFGGCVASHRIASYSLVYNANGSAVVA